MAKPKLYRAQFLITKPTRRFVKVTGISVINFYLADNENEVKAHVNTILEDIRKENGNDETIYLKTLNIKPQKFNSIHNLHKK